VIRYTFDQTGFTEALKALEMTQQEKARLLLQQVGVETIAYLRSLTSEMRPPARAGGRTRPAHPGHWADVTGQLANSYEWEVEEIDGGAALILRNHAEYAAYLEAKHGYFVLSGVADPGGPVELAIRRAADAMGWEVQGG
jgi:hypothetical protein